MNDDALDQILADWLREGPDGGRVDALDRALAATRRTSQRPRWRQPFLPGFAHANTYAKLAIRTTPQARDLRIPRRTVPMSNALRLVAVMAVIAVAAVAAFNVLRPSADVGGISAPSPTVTPSPPSPTPSPKPSPTLRTATWTTYISNRYGYTIAHPADWTVRPATGTYAAPADAPTTVTDGFIAPGATVYASVWSVAVAPGTSAEAWIQAYCPKVTAPCTGIPGRAVPISMDGHAGVLVVFTSDVEAFILVNDRMYVVAEWRPDNDQTDLHYASGTLLVEDFLSTMHLLPGGARPS
jgi:hypothetical protein